MPSFMSMYALEQLLTASTWEKKRQTLEEHQDLLLSQDALDALDALLHRPPHEASTNDEWIAQQAYLIAYRGLLYQAQRKGIRQAWAEFRMMVSQMQT